MRLQAPIGWLVGIVTAGVAVGVGELVAAFVRPAAAPVIAVGNRLITLTPESVRRGAIQSVGTNDKPLLIAGIYVLLAVFGALVGVAAVRRLAAGIAGVLVIGAFGVYCALTAIGSRNTDVIPTLAGTAAAIVALTALVRRARSYLDSAEPAHTGPARRLFVQGTVATAGLAAIAGFGGRAWANHRFSAAADRAHAAFPRGDRKAIAPSGTDLHESGVPWVTPNSGFYRVDTALAVPQLPHVEWQLNIHGMVDKPIILTYDDLIKRPLVDHWITLCCVSNPVGGPLISNALFRGALLADLLREAGIHSESDQLLMTSVDGMTIGAPAKVVLDGRPSLLAIGMNGAPLPIEHGYPVRVVVPGLYGYVSACKWVVDIEATMFQDRQAFWVRQGWLAEPPIRLESRIDRPRPGAVLPVGKSAPIAGVAWDQHVGVSKVEVQVNNDPWQRARLAAVPSTDTWRQWVVPWTPPSSGTYIIRVRAFDAKGRPQTPVPRNPFPAGATGYHTIKVSAGT